MASVILKASSAEQMGDIVLALMDYSRVSEDEFGFGPMEKRRLMRDGLTLHGKVTGALIYIRESVPDSDTIEAVAE